MIRTLEKYSEILNHTSEIGGTVSLTIKGKKGIAIFKSRLVKTNGRHVCGNRPRPPRAANALHRHEKQNAEARKSADEENEKQTSLTQVIR